MKKKKSELIYNIVVDKATFTSVEEAAYAENFVNWQKEQSEECRACTECFAALDMKAVLIGKKQMNVQVWDISADNRDGDVLIFLGKECARKACDQFTLQYKELYEEEAYRICSSLVKGKQIILIYGGGRAASLYGAAAYMEYHGIRFVLPGERGTYYNPVLDKSEEVTFDIQESPCFKTRESYSEFMFDSRYEFLLWMVHSKMNSAFMHKIENPERMHKLCLNMCGGGHTIWYKYMDVDQEYPYKHAVFGGAEKPLDPYPVSPYYKGDVNGDGILSYGEAHPEWYAEIGGERRLYRVHEAYKATGYATGDYICTSNQEAITEFSKLIVDSLVYGEMQHLSSIKLFALDNGNWCQCEECSGKVLSYRQLMLAYQLDKAIKQATREGRITRKISIAIPAYHETLLPPDRPLPEDFDYESISVIFYVIERCYLHDIDDIKCTETNKLLHDRLMSWKDGYYKGELTIGEYYNVSSFASMPFILTDRMFHDIPFYYSIGARHMHYMHMTASNKGFRALNDYVYATLLWNVDVDKEKIKEEYFSSKYGIYRDYMRSLYEELEKICANCKRIKHYQYINGTICKLSSQIKLKDSDSLESLHMKLSGRAEDYQAGPSLKETVECYEVCFHQFSDFIKDKDPLVFEEDYLQLEYGLYMLKYIFYSVEEIIEDNMEVRIQASEFRQYYRQKLNKTTRPLDGYDIRKFFKNGLTASGLYEN